ncbi:MAG: DUF72 domain-containing protein [Candidatus Promineifilaceae bacterium]|nr:DUF72 domain-containing protein [Candidatus Promineifilaceae bacterium]
MSATVRIGTSGWHYDHWEGAFYPNDMDHETRLPFYAKAFPTVEINNSFYQLPEFETLRKWQEATPAAFRFAVKASRYITHMKKLNEPEEPLVNFLSRMAEMGEKLGPILFQLPPNWHLDERRLAGFLAKLPEGQRYVLEFRHPSWFDAAVYEHLREHNVGFCIHDMAEHPSPKEVTADFVYIRFHGPAETAYQGSYETEALAGWAGAISTWQRQGRDVYCYFNNDQKGYAPRNAQALTEMLGQ